MPTKYDLAIIGSGGGAFAAAIRATTLGKSVVMIERGTLGGTCVNTGCVPSKALIAAADARHSAADAADRFPGIATTAGPVDMPALIAGKQALVESLRGEKYADVADSYGWAVRRGDAAFAGTPDAPVLQVAGDDGSTETIEAGHYLVATGSRPWAPPIDGLDQTGYLTSTTAMELTELPESLLVLGGGYVALEQAQLFARLGSQVTVLVRSRLASKEEPEVSRTLEEVFADEGIRVVRRAVPTRVSRDAATGQVVVTADVSGGSQEFRADQVLVALGRRPVTDGLNLDAVGVNTGDSGEVVVSDRMQSSHPRIWAAGDVTGHPEFVYVAAHHGTLVAENAFADADRAVEHRAAHTRERCVERLAGRLGHGRAYGGRRPHQARGRLRPDAREGLDELDRVAASEVRRHPLVAHRVAGAPCHLADRIDQERLGEPGEACDRGHLRCELGLRRALERPLRCRLADQRRGLRVQVVEPVREEVHTPHSDRGVGHGTG